MIPATTQVEIPRHPKYGGPYIIPPGKQPSHGDWTCGTCKRKVAQSLSTKTGNPIKTKKGKCGCMYYKRTTNWIDVIQDEYLLKQWGKRNVAWGMSQRPDLVLLAATCRPNHDELQDEEDKHTLDDIAKQASDVAGSSTKATIGTSLHKLTHQMDRGDTLGFVPEPYPADLKAYAEVTKGIEWVAVEQFRTFDHWVDPKCAHKWGECKCTGVAGTVDRIGWYKGRLCIMDIKTGSSWNEAGFAMQLAMYARMVPYNIATDTRYTDPDQVDLNLGYIIKLPAGQGHCELKPVHIGMGWEACKVASQVWETRDKTFYMDESEIITAANFMDLIRGAQSVEECQALWRQAKHDCALSPHVKAALSARAKELGA